jgi:protein SMG6
MQHVSPSRASTKPHREKEGTAPKPTDIAEKMIALKRKQAAKYVYRPVPSPLAQTSHNLSFVSNVRVKDRPERPVVPAQGPPSPPRRPQATSGQSPPPPAMHITTRPEPDSSEFSRILKLSPTQKHYPPPPAPAHMPGHKQQGKLYNPDTDSIPMRRAVVEPEASSESAGSSYAARAPADSSRHNNRDASQHRQLFDPRKHDPVSFSAAQARKPAPKSSGDHASVSSVSSYAQSVVSSSFTLSSGTTDGSSTPSSIFDNKPRNVSKSNAFSDQLKKLYRDISHLESRLLADSGDPQDESRIVIKGGPSAGADDAEKARWKKAIEEHKK